MLHRRFFTAEDERLLVRRVEDIVGESQISYSDEVTPRLEAAARPIASLSSDQGATTALRSGMKRPALEDCSELYSSKTQESMLAQQEPLPAPSAFRTEWEETA